MDNPPKYIALYDGIVVSIVETDGAGMRIVETLPALGKPDVRIHVLGYHRTGEWVTSSLGPFEEAPLIQLADDFYAPPSQLVSCSTPAGVESTGVGAGWCALAWSRH